MVEKYHKTVFLLDHAFQMKESCGIPLDLDSNSRSSSSRSAQAQQAFCPSFIAPTSKSLWTVVVENTLEYCRILWDVFADQRLIRVLLSNPQSTETLNGWDTSHQNIVFMSEAFAKAGPPLKNNGAVEIGIKSAIAALGEPSELQSEIMEKNKYTSKVMNKGRVICFTSYHAESDLQEYFHATLNHHNKVDALSEEVLPIQECDFIMVSIYPVGKDRKARISTNGFRDVSSTIKGEIWVIGADMLYEKIVDLVMRHHDLVVTSITGIPMKEEQNSTSSSNYDVPLFHPRMPTTSTDTMMLKWAIPTSNKGTGLGTSYPCSSACRITPVDIYSRPSTCLSNFVLGGRLAWLEMIKKGKFISHVLTAHGGEMWMHILETSRNILEDPPSISEGIGGRVTDYRIPDFVEFMRMNVLVPCPVAPPPQLSKKYARRLSTSQTLVPLEVAKARLRRKSAYWPLTISGSVLFSVSIYMDVVLSLMQNDTLTDAERMECESKIFSLIGIEARGEPPPIPSPHHKKGKRDEQWRTLYNELESFLRANLHTEAHHKILECFLNCRHGDPGKADLSSRILSKDTPMDLVKSSMPVITDSPTPPPPLLLPKRMRLDDSGSGIRMNLLDLWKRKTEKTKSIMPPSLKLYPNRTEEKSEKSRDKRDTREDRSTKLNET